MVDKRKITSDTDSFFDKEQNVASMTECTGLTQDVYKRQVMAAAVQVNAYKKMIWLIY